ncbi:MAG TPA: hypothetical protein VGM03_18785 [Phycisphaerae bacterium]|jgi:hypothetical protein
MRLRAVLPCAFALAPIGCQEEPEPPKVLAIVGSVQSINRKTGQVKMRVYHEDRGIETDESGWATAETEIMIDGRLAGFAEVREGDRAQVVGRWDKPGSEKRFVALKVEITRTTPAISASGAP